MTPFLVVLFSDSDLLDLKFGSSHKIGSSSTFSHAIKLQARGGQAFAVLHWKWFTAVQPALQDAMESLLVDALSWCRRG